MDRAFLTNTDVGHRAGARAPRPAGLPEGHGPGGHVPDWVDPPLSELGVRQADAVGRSMVGDPIAAVYASTLERAHETGRQVARHHGLDVTVLPELREVELFRDLPEGTQLTDAVDPILLRGVRERWVHDRRWDVYPYSETGEEFRHRVLMAVEGILATHPGERSWWPAMAA